MERFIRYRWILAVHIVLMCIAYSITTLFGAEHYDWYFKLVSFAWVVPPAFLFWCFHKTRAYDILAVWFVLSLSNLTDELFFNPEKVQLNEVIFALIAIIACFLKYKKTTE